MTNVNSDNLVDIAGVDYPSENENRFKLVYLFLSHEKNSSN